MSNSQDNQEMISLFVRLVQVYKDLYMRKDGVLEGILYNYASEASNQGHLIHCIIDRNKVFKCISIEKFCIFDKSIYEKYKKENWTLQQLMEAFRNEILTSYAHILNYIKINNTPNKTTHLDVHVMDENFNLTDLKNQRIANRIDIDANIVFTLKTYFAKDTRLSQILVTDEFNPNMFDNYFPIVFKNTLASAKIELEEEDSLVYIKDHNRFADFFYMYCLDIHRMFTEFMSKCFPELDEYYLIPIDAHKALLFIDVHKNKKKNTFKLALDEVIHNPFVRYLPLVHYNIKSKIINYIPTVTVKGETR